MLRTMESMQGHRLLATDGAIGKVDDFYFDDLEWIVRYLVADTRTWLPGRLVLISPQSLGQPDWASEQLPVSLSKEQIEKSPPVGADKPVSRQQEQELHGHFGWAPYSSYEVPPVDVPKAMPPSVEQTVTESSASGGAATAIDGDPHLRSSREVIGYRIQASDDEIGHVEDFVVACDDWTIRYIVVDTKNWLPGRKVLVSPTWIESVNWAKYNVRVNLTRQQVKDSPAFDPKQPINREYETRLYDYYGRPSYW